MNVPNLPFFTAVEFKYWIIDKRELSILEINTDILMYIKTLKHLYLIQNRQRAVMTDFPSFLPGKKRGPENGE